MFVCWSFHIKKLEGLSRAYAPKPSMSRSSLMTTSSSESPGDPLTVIFSPSLLMKFTVTLLSDLCVCWRGKETNKQPV